MSTISDRIWQQILDATISYGLTALLLLILCWAAVKMRSWYRDDSGPAADVEDLLVQFRDLHRRGHISESEFRSIKGQLVDQPNGSLAESTEQPPAHPATDEQTAAS